MAPDEVRAACCEPPGTGPCPLPQMAHPSCPQKPVAATPGPAPRAPTFHVVLLVQLDPAEVGDGPQGDVEGLSHAHFKAIKMHLQLGTHRCEPGGPAVSRAPSLAWPAPPRTAGTQERGPQSSGLGRTRSPGGRAAGSSQGTAAPVRQKLGVGPAGLGQAPASPATPPAGGGRLWRPARSDTESPGCPDSWSRPPGPAGSLREGRGRAGGSDQGRESSFFPSSL